MDRLPVIIFDLDGVLVDSWALARDAFVDAHRLHCSGSAPLADFERHLGEPLGVILSKMGLPQAMKGAFEAYAREHVDRVDPFPGILGLLERLAKNGHRMSVLTGKDAARTAQVLRSTGIAPYFSVVVTPDDAPGKPHPGGPLSCVARLRACAADAVLVGDSQVDMDAARNAGIRPIFATWGARAPIIRTAYDYLVRSPEDLWVLVATLSERALACPAGHRGSQ